MSHSNFLFLLIAATLTACTQSAAPVSQRGGDYFGRGQGAMSGSPNDLQVEPRYYSKDSPKLKDGYAVQSIPATAGAVGVSELPPPVEAKELAPPAPRSALDTPKPVAKATPSESAMPDAVAPPAPEIAKAETPSPTKTTTMIWPVEGKIISKFGAKGTGRANDGINIQAAEGEPIYAAATGTVTYVGNSVKGYGTMALLQHQGGRFTTYAHANDIVVKKGDAVKQGQVIGYVGKTGGVDTAQLHFSVREGKEPVDPLRYLPRMVALANG